MPRWWSHLVLSSGSTLECHDTRTLSHPQNFCLKLFSDHEQAFIVHTKAMSQRLFLQTSGSLSKYFQTINDLVIKLEF